MAKLDSYVGHLQAGGLVIMPTETVYGLAGDSTNPDAIAQIYQTKGRPAINPLIIHCAEWGWVNEFAQLNERAEILAKKFMPGPVSLILPLRAGHKLAKNALAGLDSVCVRIPAHPLARQLIQQFGRPLAAPSANPSGQLSPTRPEHIQAFANAHNIPILDGGDAVFGLESTIIDTRTDPIQIARLGVISAEAMTQKTGLNIGIPTTHNQKPISPGQLLRHYAPHKPLRINCTNPGADEYYIGFGALECDFNLSPNANEFEMAKNIFHALWLADASPKPRIATAPIPPSDIGMAINDKLMRAVEK